MEHTFEICFNAEYPDIGSFERFIQESLEFHQLSRDHTVECIIERACIRCKPTKSNKPIVKIHLAWLKTVSLEIILELSQAKNRQKFDAAVQALFDDNDSDSLPFCASITRMLRQFRLSGTYEAKDVISEAYTRGVKKITSGERIDVPLAWLRGTCLRVVRELKQKQQRLDNPKFDPEDCVTEDVVFSEIILQEDLWTLQLALQQLSQEEHQLLDARILKCLSWQEIGEFMLHPNHPPLSPGTARQRGSRALKKLRQHYHLMRDDVQLSDTVNS
jgi:RNA polymerase sigma factor (sigma-70 family)